MDIVIFEQFIVSYNVDSELLDRLKLLFKSCNQTFKRDVDQLNKNIRSRSHIRSGVEDLKILRS